MTTRYIVLTLSSLIFAAGCAYQQRDGYYSYGLTTHGSETLARTDPRAADRSLEESVRYQINRYGDLAADTANVQVSCRDGVATLSGSVPNERDKDMMEACVRNTSGVLRVDNQLAIIYPPTGGQDQNTVYTAPQNAPETTTAYPSEPPPTTTPPPQTTTSLAAGPVAVDALNVQVQASTDADRDCAQRIIDAVRSDPAFTSEAPTITVSLNGGRAFIYGTAESRPQRRAIVDAVKRVPGVVEVRDDIRLR